MNSAALPPVADGQSPIPSPAGRIFGTGSRRDSATGKGRFDLISPHALFDLARVLERGAAKYGERNWEKGQPMQVYLDAAMRHLCAYAAQRSGASLDYPGASPQDDHLTQALWNIHAACDLRAKVSLGLLSMELMAGTVEEAGGQATGDRAEEGIGDRPSGIGGQ